MLDKKIQKKLESSSQVPTIPHVITQVLNAVEDENLSALALASIIEQDQSLTMRVLTVANSPIYGFSRRISTIDLASLVSSSNVFHLPTTDCAFAVRIETKNADSNISFNFIQ